MICSNIWEPILSDYQCNKECVHTHYIDRKVSIGYVYTVYDIYYRAFGGWDKNVTGTIG